MSSFLQDSLERFLCKQGLYSLVEDNRPTVLDSTLFIILQNPTIIVNKIQVWTIVSVEKSVSIYVKDER